jgi:hypothetical protein
MFGLKITQTNGTSEIISDTNCIAIQFSAPALSSGSILQPAKIVGAMYSKLVTTTLTYFNDTVAAYTGANVRYEYGELSEAGSFRVIASN